MTPSVDPPGESAETIAAELGDEFTHVHLLARGANATIVKAVQRTTGRPVAIKLSSRRDSGTVPLRDPEVQALVSLSWHPNIATLIDAGLTASGRLWVCMELATTTLAERLARHPLPPVELLRIANELSSAVAAVHSQSVVHSDLKPSNVLLAQDGGVRVTDFGIARLLRLPAPTIEVPQGTAQYIAPEVLEGGQPTAASDVWGIGVTLWAAAHGRPPFGGDDQPLVAVLNAANAGVVAWNPPSSFVGPEADRIREVVRECTRPEPKDRPSATEVVAMLGRPIREPAGHGSVHHPRRGGRWAIAALVTSLVAAGAAFSLRDVGGPILQMPREMWCRSNAEVGDAMDEALTRAANTIRTAPKPDAEAVTKAFEQLYDDVGRAAEEWGALIANEPALGELRSSLRRDNVLALLMTEYTTYLSSGQYRGIGISGLKDMNLDHLPKDIREQAEALGEAVGNASALCPDSVGLWRRARDDFGVELSAAFSGYFFENGSASELLIKFFRTMIQVEPNYFMKLALDHPQWFVGMLEHDNFVELITSSSEGSTVFMQIAMASPHVACRLSEVPALSLRLEDALIRDAPDGEQQRIQLRDHLEGACQR